VPATNAFLAAPLGQPAALGTIALYAASIQSIAAYAAMQSSQSREAASVAADNARESRGSLPRTLDVRAVGAALESACTSGKELASLPLGTATAQIPGLMQRRQSSTTLSNKTAVDFLLDHFDSAGPDDALVSELAVAQSH
jgi:hypothetical protein